MVIFQLIVSLILSLVLWGLILSTEPWGPLCKFLKPVLYIPASSLELCLTDPTHLGLSQSQSLSPQSAESGSHLWHRVPKLTTGRSQGTPRAHSLCLLLSGNSHLLPITWGLKTVVSYLSSSVLVVYGKSVIKDPCILPYTKTPWTSEKNVIILLFFTKADSRASVSSLYLKYLCEKKK